MLLGEYSYKMERKGRLPIPSKLRTEMGKKVIIAQGFEEYLAVYQLGEFKKLTDKLKKLSLGIFENRHFVRLISASAERIDIDRQGRVRLSAKLREFASLEVGEVIILGVIDHLEIWNPMVWQEFKEKKKIIDMAERITRLS